MKKKTKVLIICGGGIFGYIPAKLLASTGFGDNGYEMADVFGGTSIGGILSLMYSFGYTPDEAEFRFIKLAELAFSRSFWQKFKPWGPKFDGKGIEKALYNLFGDSLYSELHAPAIIPCIDFRHNRPKVYDNIVEDADMDVRVRDIARATSSAPTYFPPHRGFIDGGLTANDPTIITAAAVRNKKKIPFKDMDVLVLGTGNIPDPDRDADKMRSWSSIRWLGELMGYFTKGNEMSTEFISGELGFNSYTYYNPVSIDDSWDMSDTGLINKLDELTEPYTDEFREIFSKFRDS